MNGRLLASGATDAAAQAFALSHSGVLLALDCDEHTHVRASRRARALEMFVDAFTASVQALSSTSVLVSGISTPGAAWSVSDAQYNSIEFKVW